MTLTPQFIQITLDFEHEMVQLPFHRIQHKCHVDGGWNWT